jgi:hypothetical protein
MIVHDLLEYLETQSIGTRAVNLFAYHVDSPDECVILRVYDSREGFYHSDSGKTEDEHVFIQVETRGKAANLTEQKAKAVHALLHVRKGELSGKPFYSLQCLQRPVPLGKDTRNRHRFVFNLEVHAPERMI